MAASCVSPQRWEQATRGVAERACGKAHWGRISECFPLSFCPPIQSVGAVDIAAYCEKRQVAGWTILVRQHEVKTLLEALDRLIDEIGSLNCKLVLVIGSPNSSNSGLLAELAKRRQAQVLGVGSALGRSLLSVPASRRHLQVRSGDGCTLPEACRTGPSGSRSRQAL